MDTPAIDIDYGRPFSLPFGLAPTTDAAYIGGLDVETGFVFYLRHPAAPKWPPDALEVAGIPFADGSGKLALVPASTTAELGVVLSRVSSLTKPMIKLVGAVTPPTNGYRWDGPSAKTGPFPLPSYDDGAFVMRWSPSATVTPSGAVTNGIAENFLAEYLLATHAVGGDGEAARDLLRAPVVSLVRFERYRHLELNGGTLSVGASCATTGAIVMRSRAGGRIPPPGHPPVLGSALAIFENVDRASAVTCLGRLVWCSLIRREDVRNTLALRADASLVECLLVQAYLDYLQVARPTHRPAMPDPIPLLAPALRQPFEKTLPKPKPAQIVGVIDRCTMETTLRASLLNFVTTVFAEIIAGATWSEIGCTAVGGPGVPPAALADAHKRLKLLESSTATWLPCFAGAPVGQAAPVVVRTANTPDPSVAAQESLTLFHLEALTAAEQPTPATEDYGSLAVLRIVDDGGLDTLLTTRDFLDAIVKGSNTATRFGAPLDLADLASLGHPYAGAVDWARFVRARAVLERLEALRKTTMSSGRSLDAANIAFWKERTGLSNVAGQWPMKSALPYGPTESLPTPANPYASPANRPFPNASGFDDYDLEAVMRARSVVLDGRSGEADIPVPLFLALLDREGYRSQADIDRNALRIPNPNIGAIDRRSFALANWLSFPFGLDLLIRGTPPAAGHMTGFPLKPLSPTRFDASFPSIHAQLVGPLGVLDNVLESLLKEADCLDYLALRRTGRPLPPTGISMFLRSRSAQWMGIALQMAAFQWIHQQLTIATGARKVTPFTNDEWVAVDEYVNNPPPSPGAHANTDERRRFIGYWSLVYLAFNTSPPTWNCWINSVPDTVINAGIPISVYLTDHKNSAPRVIDGTAFITPDQRSIGQRGHMVRFAAGLDAYMRLGINGDQADLVDPQARTPPGPGQWPLP